MYLRLISIALAILLVSCSSSNPAGSRASANYSDIDASEIDTSDFLVATSPEGELYESGYPFVFRDQKGEVVIPEGTYQLTFMDTLKTFAIVIDSSSQLIGIDREGQLLYEVFQFDNGPDYVEEGLFRVMRNGKIGYANTKGEVVIPCRFECAHPFHGGQAKVAEVCTESEEGEHTRWESDAWYFIDRSGRKKP